MAMTQQAWDTIANEAQENYTQDAADSVAVETQIKCTNDVEGDEAVARLAGLGFFDQPGNSHSGDQSQDISFKQPYDIDYVRTNRLGHKEPTGFYYSVEFRDCFMDNAKFENCRFINVTFTDCTFNDVVWDSVYLRDVAFINCIFDHYIWRCDKMEDSKIAGEILQQQIHFGDAVPVEISDPSAVVRPLKHSQRRSERDRQRYWRDREIALALQAEEKQDMQVVPSVPGATGDTAMEACKRLFEQVRIVSTTDDHQACEGPTASKRTGDATMKAIDRLFTSHSSWSTCRSRSHWLDELPAPTPSRPSPMPVAWLHRDVQKKTVRLARSPSPPFDFTPSDDEACEPEEDLGDNDATHRTQQRRPDETPAPNKENKRPSMSARPSITAVRERQDSTSDGSPPDPHGGNYPEGGPLTPESTAGSDVGSDAEQEDA